MTVLYKGSVPDLFRTGRDVVVTGTQRADGTFVDDPRVDDHEVPVEVPGREVLSDGRARSRRAHRHARALALRARRRRRGGRSRSAPARALCAERARRRVLLDARRDRRARRRLPARRLLARVRRRATRAARSRCRTRSPPSGAGRKGRCSSGCSSSPAYSALAVWLTRKRARDLVVWVTPVLAGIAVGFSWLLVAVSSPFDTIPAAARRQRAQPEPPEPVHGRAPACSSTSATSGSRCRSRSRWARCSRAGPTSAGSSRRAAGRSSRGRRSGSASCSARTGPTRRSAGAATTPGIRSRTPR